MHDAVLYTGAKPLLLRAFFEAIVRVAHATGDASLSLADRVLALMKESIIPFARTDSAVSSGSGTSASAFMAEFASPPVRDKLAQFKSLLHALFARYAGVELPPAALASAIAAASASTTSDSASGAEIAGASAAASAADAPPPPTKQQLAPDLTAAIGAVSLGVRDVIQMFRDFGVLDTDQLTVAAVVRAMVGLSESESENESADQGEQAGTEMQYLDSAILYDQFVEGVVRCADQKFALALDTPTAPPSVAATPLPADPAAAGAGAEAAAAGSDPAAAGDAASAEGAGEGGSAATQRAMPLDRKLQQFCLMFTRAV
jgi:hypothetical protein